MHEDASVVRARQLVRACLTAYASAVKAGDAQVVELLLRFRDAWAMLCSLPGAAEAEAGPDMDLVLALSYAVEAQNGDEAAKLYEMMTTAGRATIDRAEEYRPRLVKIW